MIPFEEIDSRLERLGKNRAWLAEETDRSPDSIRAALAPNAAAKSRSLKLQRVLSEVIEKEEALQTAASAPLAAGFQSLFLTDDQLRRADIASRIIGSPTIMDFCKEAIEFRADEILNFNRDPVTDELPTLRVAEEPNRAKSPRSGHA